jgi:hypothetical protein
VKIFRKKLNDRERFYQLAYEDGVLAFTGNCAIREYTGDGYPVGRCWHSLYDDICPRHGLIEMYPDNDDRAVDPQERKFKR